MAERDDLWAGMAPVLAQARGFVLATVVSTTSSAPRPVGTQMAVLDDGTVIGSLSGGCIEADVHAQAQEVTQTGEPLVRDYGYSDGMALDIGLTCGGSMRVLLERVRPEDTGFFRALADAIREGAPVAAVTALTGVDAGRRALVGAADAGRPGRRCPTFSEAELQARTMLQQHRSGVVEIPGAGDEPGGEYFVRSYGGPAHLLVFGSNAFAAALVRSAKAVGYRVTVCDARAVFTSRERFPEADEVVVRWPHEYLAEVDVDSRTVLCAMTHDPKFDDPLLAAALRSPAGFVGAMGSRRTSDERYARLRRLGLTDQELARLHAPFGLDLGASTPQETAVSMMAEIISVRRAGSNLPLRQVRGPIHAAEASPAV